MPNEGAHLQIQERSMLKKYEGDRLVEIVSMVDGRIVWTMSFDEGEFHATG